MDREERQQKLEEDIKAAEKAIEEDPERIPIVSDSLISEERVHGYVKPGEKPVACTGAFKPTLESTVQQDGTVSGRVVAPPEADHAHHFETLSPGDDGYLFLLNDLMSGYSVKGE